MTTSSPPSPSALQGLLKAYGSAAPLPLHAGRGQAGLFPATAAGRKAAAEAVAAGWLVPQGTVPCGRKQISAYQLTSAGQQEVEVAASPVQVMEEIRHGVQRCQEELGRLRAAAELAGENLARLTSRLEQCLPQVTAARIPINRMEETIPTAVYSRLPAFQAPLPENLTMRALELLRSWLRERPSADCPLGELYRALHRSHPELTVGQFHDLIRRLAQDGAVRLQAWTGPLAELPDPSLALMHGHAVMSYVTEAESAAAVD